MRKSLFALGFALAVSRSGAAQANPSRALDLERRGDYAGAATAWREVLAARPGNLAALLGLERALTPLGRLPEMTDQVRAAARQDSSPGVLGIAIRVWTAARQPDSARAAVERWSAADPTSEAPFQEWGMAAYSARDRVNAKAAYQLGRQLLRRPDALAAELGQVAALEGDYAAAAREWLTAIRRIAGYRVAAVSTLSQVPAAGRTALLKELTRNGDLPAERLAVSLLARWGEPLAGVKRLAAALPASGSEAIDALQETLEELRGTPTPELLLARATALELVSDRVATPQRARLRLDAAQAYADGGDQTAARRMLARMAGDPTATPAMAATATSTLVGVLVDEGGVEEADRRYRELAPLLGAEDRQRLGIRLAQGWIRMGRLGRADTLLVADSSVEAMAVKGKLALFRGELVQASELLKEAGPFTGERPAATERLSVLGLLQVLEVDSLPALGEAFYQLERRDSATAAAGFERLAPTVPADHGGAELLLLGGRLRAGLGQTANAERDYRAVVTQAVPASSAAAEFALADLLLRAGKKDAAIASLEHLLLTWPTSAVVPQARRLLDVARGAVPST
jgi:tetratricopeptide (TPR) repeat protein